MSDLLSLVVNLLLLALALAVAVLGTAVHIVEQEDFTIPQAYGSSWPERVNERLPYRQTGMGMGID